MIEVYLVIHLLVSSFPLLHGDDSLVVDTSSGKVVGERMVSDLGKEVEVWGKIPFAEPPVGNLRFQHPKPIKNWKGVLNVTGKPNSCVQTEGIAFPGHPGEEVWTYNTPISEDCLYLSITKPAGRRAVNLPVMVWVYGGGYYSGTSTLELYDPKILSTEMNVVVAAIQYRLGSIGFLYLGNEDVPGNAGMMDQVLALKWIKQNIRKFGGNENSITLFSESAGSASVAYHMLSPLSYKLFNRAILQSASALNPWGLISVQEAKRRSLALATVLNCPTDPKFLHNTISCLKAANASELMHQEWNGLSVGLCSFPFVPIVDGMFMPYTPTAILQSGKFPKKEVLLGANKEEGMYFLIYYLTDLLQLTESVTQEQLPFSFKNSKQISISKEQYESAVGEINLYVKHMGLAAIKYMYTNWTQPYEPTNLARKRIYHQCLPEQYLSGSLDRMSGDFLFTCPVVQFAEALAKTDHNKNVYLYYFNHRTRNSPWPTWSGVMHGDEVAYVFGDPFRKFGGAVNYTDEERLLSLDIMTYWSNFAKTGDPNKYSNGSWVPTTGGSYWPVHSQANREYLELRSPRHVNRTAFKIQECQFWKTYLPSLLKSDNPPEGDTQKGPCSGCKCPRRRFNRPACEDHTHTPIIMTTMSLTLLSTILPAAAAL